MKQLKVGARVQILAVNAYRLKPQVATIQRFHTENGWREDNGWVYLDIGEARPLLFWPGEYEVIEDWM